MISLARLLVPVVLVVAVSGAFAANAAGVPQTVRVVIEQTYEFRRASHITYEPIAGFELPVSDLVEDMLYAAGMEPLAADDPGDADATIRVVVDGRAIGGSYLEPVKDYLYTGAQIAGTITIEQPGEPDVTNGYVSEMQRPFRISFNLGYEDPANAPFDTVLMQPGGFVRELATVIASVWGVDAILPSLQESNPSLRYNVAALLGDIGDAAVVPDLVEALVDDNARVRWEAAWSLGRIGDPAAIPDLIETLHDPSEDVRWFASWSLRVITGADLGVDYDAWTAWQQDYEADAGT